MVHESYIVGAIHSGDIAMDSHITETGAAGQGNKIVFIIEADAVGSVPYQTPALAQNHFPGVDDAVPYFPLPAHNYIVADLVPGKRGDFGLDTLSIGNIQ